MRNSIKKRVMVLFANSRAKNPKQGEVVIETLGDKPSEGSTYLYTRGGIPKAIKLAKKVVTNLFGWAPWAKNPNLILAKSEAILVRLGEDKSFIVTKEGVTEVPNESFKNN